MTLKECLIGGVDKLKDANIDNAEYDAYSLLEYVFLISKDIYVLNKHNTISSDKIKAYNSLIDMRVKHIPLQHIIKTQNFYGYDFYVDSNVLIPRFDTEILVEKILSLDIIQRDKRDVSILDMCTGSGCIAIALYLELHKMSKGCHISASDISEKALSVASININRLIGEDNYYEDNNNLKLIQSDIFDNIDKTCYDIIVSNPPYIPTDEIGDLDEEVRLHDPLLALDGGHDGLIYYKKIIDKAPQFINSNGHLCLEIGYNQKDDVTYLLSNRGFRDIRVYKDLTNLDRVIIARME